MWLYFLPYIHFLACASSLLATNTTRHFSIGPTRPYKEQFQVLHSSNSHMRLGIRIGALSQVFAQLCVSFFQPPRVEPSRIYSVTNSFFHQPEGATSPARHQMMQLVVDYVRKPKMSPKQPSDPPRRTCQ
ncbi:hypothetical protein Scep_009740 [Stephania cephalantha]|uniref:Secreted protein n=1 Tax=Stephania cephalantha TaxID=152367 RepID=A0AAP0JUJ2_9MAGN